MRLDTGTPTRVFPAYAGMFLYDDHADWNSPGFPRVCGDVPKPWTRPDYCSQFSPRMRGCSGLTLSTLRSNRVFPAYAGMFHG